MEYINKRTGAIIDTQLKIAGEEWELVEKTDTTKKGTKAKG